ncbi:MAG: hypothetical protein Ct9H90mP19_2010 [Gammaproteobacteria bacterium]|nr:MAG: hypothetical protein Ct9H90mP19_2010 [Gammaproteobacteria bacterium]
MLFQTRILIVLLGNFEVEDKGKNFNIISEKRVYKVGSVITSETGIALI